MIRKSISQQVKMTLIIASLICIFSGYLFLAHRQKQINPKDTTIPNLTQFFEGVQKIMTPSKRGEIMIWRDFSSTYQRLAMGLFFGVFGSIILGVAMGCFPKVEYFFIFPLSFLSQIPPTAMMAVYFVIFGVNTEFFIAAVALGIMPVLAQSVHQAAKKDVSDHAVYKAYTLGASNAEVIWNVVIPQIKPRIIENFRLMIGPAMIFLVAAEWYNANVGVGYTLRIHSRLSDMSVVYIYLVLLGAIGYGMDLAIKAIRLKVCPWFGE